MALASAFLASSGAETNCEADARLTGLAPASFNVSGAVAGPGALTSKRLAVISEAGIGCRI